MNTQLRRVLIVSASIGEGHQQAARALAGELRRRQPEALVRIADFMDGDNSYLNTLAKETYLKMIHISPNIYDLLYRWSQAPSQYSTVQQLLARAMKRTMARLYYRHRPDIVIFTHPFPCAAAAYLKRTHRLEAPLIAVATDFSVHPLWVSPEVDMYLVAGDAARTELTNLGVSAEKIFPTGIPINASFGRTSALHCAVDRLKLDPGLPAVLVMGGGLGLGPLEQIIQRLGNGNVPLQVIVVCGKNPELRRRAQQIARLAKHRMTVLGFTHQVRELMALATLLITKPGALTLSEGLAAGLPMVLIDPIPGQEEDNASQLVDEGAAVLALGADAACAAVEKLLTAADELAVLRGNAARLAHPNAAENAADLILQQVGRKRRGVLAPD